MLRHKISGWRRFPNEMFCFWYISKCSVAKCIYIFKKEEPNKLKCLIPLFGCKIAKKYSLNNCIFELLADECTIALYVYFVWMHSMHAFWFKWDVRRWCNFTSNLKNTVTSSFSYNQMHLLEKLTAFNTYEHYLGLKRWNFLNGII